MRLSEMNRRITIQKGETVSDFYQDGRSFSDFYSCFARISEKSLSENVRDGNLVLTETAEFDIRDCGRLKDLNSDEYRIVFDDRIYDILSVSHEQFKGRFLKITARRRKSDDHTAA